MKSYNYFEEKKKNTKRKCPNRKESQLKEFNLSLFSPFLLIFSRSLNQTTQKVYFFLNMNFDKLSRSQENKKERESI